MATLNATVSGEEKSLDPNTISDQTRNSMDEKQRNENKQKGNEHSQGLTGHRVLHSTAESDQVGPNGSEKDRHSPSTQLETGSNRQQFQAQYTNRSPVANSAQFESMATTPSPTKRRNNLNDPQLTINILYTQYEIIHEVAAECNFRTSVEDDEDWDIWFIDGPTLPSLLQKMKSYQRTNHFPGMYVIARKNLLAKNLLNMQKYFPNDYQFFPRTWLLPTDLKSFKEQFNSRKAKTFIIKPEASCQGKGIFLTRNYDWINPQEHYVAQRYLHKPYLIDGLKFDLRVYVNITCFTPLRVFIYNEGLARFATSEYNSPIGSNLNNLYMHLTNYAINKDADNFQQNAGHDDQGHKRSMTSIFQHIDEARLSDPEMISGDQCWQQIKELTVKTIIACHSQIAHIYRSAKPQDLEGNLCMQILGFDVFLDKKAKPQLIEVNQSPSFMTDSPIDEKVKKGLLTDSFRQLNLTWRRKNKYINQQRQEMQNRLIGAKRLTLEEREQIRAKKIKIKDKHEMTNAGNFERIYPLPEEEIEASESARQLQDQYDLLIEGNHAVFGEQAAGGGVCAKGKIEELLKNQMNKIKGLKKTSTTDMNQQQQKTPVMQGKIKSQKISNLTDLYKEQKSSTITQQAVAQLEQQRQVRVRVINDNTSNNVKLQAALLEQGLLMPKQIPISEADMRHNFMVKATNASPLEACRKSRSNNQSQNMSNGFSIKVKETHSKELRKTLNYQQNQQQQQGRPPSDLNFQSMVASHHHNQSQLSQHDGQQSPSVNSLDRRINYGATRRTRESDPNVKQNKEMPINTRQGLGSLNSMNSLASRESSQYKQQSQQHINDPFNHRQQFLNHQQQLQLQDKPQSPEKIPKRQAVSNNNLALKQQHQQISTRPSRDSLVQGYPHSQPMTQTRMINNEPLKEYLPGQFSVDPNGIQWMTQMQPRHTQGQMRKTDVQGKGGALHISKDPHIQANYQVPQQVQTSQKSLSSSAAFSSYKEQLSQVINQQTVYSNNKQKTNRQNSTFSSKPPEVSPSVHGKISGKQQLYQLSQGPESPQKVLPHQILAAQHGVQLGSPRQDNSISHFQKPHASQPASFSHVLHQPPGGYTVIPAQQLVQMQQYHKQNTSNSSGQKVQGSRPPLKGAALVLHGSQIKSDK